MVTAEVFIKALGSTLLGMGTVFLVLIFISLIIYTFRWMYLVEEAYGRMARWWKNRKNSPAPSVEALRDLSSEEDEISDETVAVIAAALASYFADTQAGTQDGYVVRRIRRYGN